MYSIKCCRQLVLVTLLCLGKTIATPTLPVMVPIDELTDQITVATGEEPGDGFAESIRFLGDINGDGLADFAFSGTTDDEEEPVTYNVYIFYGQKKLPQTIDVSQSASWGIHLHSRSGERYPMPIKGTGDVNGDGFDDMVFRPCSEVIGEPCPGYILFGGPDLPTSIDTATFEGCNGCELSLDTSVVSQTIKRFDSWTSGDFNNDQKPDLVISSTNISPQEFPEQSGMVYIILGADSFTDAIDLTQIGTTIPGCRISASHENFSTATGELFGSRIGDTVSGHHDFNADGLADLIISAPYWEMNTDEGQFFGGAVFVLFGGDAWPAFIDLNADEGRKDRVCFIASEREMIGFDRIEGTQDATGDGIDDLLVSGGGNMYLISGAKIKPGDYNIDNIKETTFINSSGFCGTAMGDWSGDGIVDFCFGSPGDTSRTYESAIEAGAAYLVYGKSEYPGNFFVETNPESFDKIIGRRQYASLGKEVLSADVNGNGKKELIVTASGRSLGPVENRTLGKIYIIPQETKILRPLTCGDFSPGSTDLEGGTRMYVTGKGFDDQTKLYIGNNEAEILEGSHSRQLIVRMPEVKEPASLPLRVERGTETCTFEKELVYYDSIFPREVNVLELGNQGCTIYEPNTELPGLLNSINYVKGSGDFTGDGLSDIVFGYKVSTCSHHNPIFQYICKLFLIHGAENLPEEIRISENISEWATIFQTTETGDCKVDCFGKYAILVGDMNGDNISELMISASYLQHVYLILGGEVPKGPVNIYDLIDAGRCIVIEDCHGDEIIRCGDLNGDGLSDAGIVYDGGEGEDCVLSFVLGREDFPGTISYSTFPKLIGVHPSNGSAYMNNFDALGDVNGDGFDDLAFGVVKINNPDKGYEKYRARAVFWGRSSFAPSTTYEEELANGGACIFVKDDHDWSFCFGKVGDQNGDGLADIGLTTYLFHPEVNPATGKFRIIFGGGKEKVCQERDISKDGDFDLTFPYSVGYNGIIWFISGGKDINNDDKPEILLSDFHDMDFNGAPPPGRAITIFGGDLKEKQAPLADLIDSFEIVNYESEGYLGRRYPSNFDFGGDVNGDGYEDLVLISTTRAYIYFNPLGTLDMYFVRGDVNQDGSKNIADVITVLEYLFAEKSLLCFDAADINDDEAINIADPIYLLAYLFAEGNQVPPPVECGSDPEGNKLGCAESICQQVIVE